MTDTTFVDKVTVVKTDWLNDVNTAVYHGTLPGTGTVAVASGGTGATTAAGARTNLGLGDMSVQNKAAVDITGGTVVNITDLAIADGGTGASTKTAAFDALSPNTTRGDLTYFNGTNNVRLAAGTATNVLMSNGPGTDPSWAAAGTGDMVLASTQTVTGAKTFGTIGGTVGKLILAGSSSGSTILNASAVAGSTTVTLPGSTDTLVGLATTDTFTGVKTFNDAKLVLAGSSSGTSTLKAAAVAGTTTLTLQGTTGTVYSTSGTDVAIADGGTGQSTKTLGYDALNPNTTQGDITYHNGTNNVRLAKGTALQGLRMNAGATAPEWALTGTLLQRVGSVTGAVATGTTTIPIDDTIPQNTEGDQYLSQAITPSNSANILVIDVIMYMAASTAQNLVVALFQDTTANALAATVDRMNTTDVAGIQVLRHIMTAGTTSATTFKVRAGCGGAATVTINGTGGARKFGGVSAASLMITEYTS